MTLSSAPMLAVIVGCGGGGGGAGETTVKVEVEAGPSPALFCPQTVKVTKPAGSGKAHLTPVESMDLR